MADGMKAASFFSGIGGLDLAAEYCGISTVFMCEADQYCRRILRRHWPHVTMKHDIRQVVASDIPASVDVFHAGFPCQDISLANSGEGIHGKRSGLFFEFMRIARNYRPRYILLENVAAILTRHGAIVVASLTEAGYDAQWWVVPAYVSGSPQNRERWFCVAMDNTNSQRREGKDAPEKLCGNTEWTDSAKQQIPQRYAPVSARHGSRKRHRRLSQSRMGRNAHGLSARLDKHKWPAGSWQAQYPYEPSRLTEDYATRKSRIKALGNSVVPQQAIPFFQMIANAELHASSDDMPDDSLCVNCMQHSD